MNLALTVQHLADAVLPEVVEVEPEATGSNLGDRVDLGRAGRRVLTEADCRALQAALSDPGYVARLLVDARAADRVEVDNPFRRESRPRRGTEGLP